MSSPRIPIRPNPYNSLHIETTNRCVLACPGCPRTTWKDLLKSPVAKTDLDVDLLERFLDCDGGRKINRFYLCGDYGDSIYYPDLLKLIERFRDKVSFEIVTNGSRQTEKFWNNLSSLLTDKDRVTFSIDGLADTNHLYRINSDWPSIERGIDIIARSSAQMHWKTIVFNFNVEQLEKIKSFANAKGATFHAEKTHRFGNDDLKPNTQYVETNHLFQPDFTKNEPIEIEPRCISEARVITADGYLSPCNWIRNPRTFYKSQLWRQKQRWLDKLKMENNTFDQALLVIKDWENYVIQNGLESGNVDVLCKMLCRKNCVADNRIMQ